MQHSLGKFKNYKEKSEMMNDEEGPPRKKKRGGNKQRGSKHDSTGEGLEGYEEAEERIVTARAQDNSWDEGIMQKAKEEMEKGNNDDGDDDSDNDSLQRVQQEETPRYRKVRQVPV